MAIVTVQARDLPETFNVLDKGADSSHGGVYTFQTFRMFGRQPEGFPDGGVVGKCLENSVTTPCQGPPVARALFIYLSGLFSPGP